MGTRSIRWIGCTRRGSWRSSERDFWRFARTHLRCCYFPKLCTQGQFNRRVRPPLEPEMRALQRAFAGELAAEGPSAVYRVLETTLIPVMVRVRGAGKVWSPGRGHLLRTKRLQKSEWVYGFKAALWWWIRKVW